MNFGQSACFTGRSSLLKAKSNKKEKKGEWKGKGWCCLLKRPVLSCQPGHQRRSFSDNQKNNLCLAAEIWGFTFYQYLNLLLCRPWGFLSQWRWVCRSFDASLHDKKRAFEKKKTSHIFRGESWKTSCWTCGVFSALFLCILLRKQSRWTVADPSLVMLFPSYGRSRACLKLAARGSSNPQMSPSSPPGTCYWSHLDETRKKKSPAWSLCKEKEAKEKQSSLMLTIELLSPAQSYHSPAFGSIGRSSKSWAEQHACRTASVWRKSRMHLDSLINRMLKNTTVHEHEHSTF